MRITDKLIKDIIYVNRAGLLIHSDSKSHCVVIQSKFVPRLRADGTDAAMAMEVFLQLVQNPTDWRRVAQEFLPSLVQLEVLQDLTQTPMDLWIELWNQFLYAYKSRNHDLLSRIFGYAEWCAMQIQSETINQAEHLLTCVFVNLYEPICNNLEMVTDIPRWFSLEEFEESGLLSSHWNKNRDLIKMAYEEISSCG